MKIKWKFWERDTDATNSATEDGKQEAEVDNNESILSAEQLSEIIDFNVTALSPELQISLSDNLLKESSIAKYLTSDIYSLDKHREPQTESTLCQLVFPLLENILQQGLDMENGLKTRDLLNLAQTCRFFKTYLLQCYPSHSPFAEKIQRERMYFPIRQVLERHDKKDSDIERLISEFGEKPYWRLQ